MKNLKDQIQDDENMDCAWDDTDPDFDDFENDDGDWDGLTLNEDGQQLIPIQNPSQLTLSEVLKSINLPPDININDIPKEVLSKLVEKMPTAIFDKLQEKYGDKIEEEIQQNKKQKYRHKLAHICNMKDVIELMNKSSNILILCGAGISTAANIPDFRSKDGLYDEFKQNHIINRETNDPTDIFDLDFFLKNGPHLFYSYGTQKLFNNNTYLPTKTHHFIKTLQDYNKLLRCHTQNIDGLELKAGILRDKVNHCHGTTSEYKCVNCLFTIKTTSHLITQNINNKSIPYCIKCRNIKTETYLNKDDIISNGIDICKEEKDEFTNVLRIRIPSLLISELKRKTNILKQYRLSLEYSVNADVKHEMHHILELRHDDDDVLEDLKGQILKWLKSFASFGVLKPNTVFFNESLKKESLDLICDDVKHCDLVFVIGTSMLVDPFGSIPNLLDKKIPLILMNREVVGLSQYQFDVYLLGECDDICEHILHQHKHQYTFVPPNYCIFKNGKLPQIAYTMKSIPEQCGYDIGDEIEYKYIGKYDKCSDWYKGRGVVLGTDQQMIQIKINYGTITFKVNEIEIKNIYK